MYNQRPLIYILDDHTPIPATYDEFLQWQKKLFKETGNRIVHVDETFVLKTKISTIFMGVDHNCGYGEPILFETMIFGGAHDGYQQRYHTWEAAQLGHAYAVDLARAKLSFARLLNSVIPIFDN